MMKPKSPIPIERTLSDHELGRITLGTAVCDLKLAVGNDSATPEQVIQNSPLEIRENLLEGVISIGTRFDELVFFQAGAFAITDMEAYRAETRATEELIREGHRKFYRYFVNLGEVPGGENSV